MKLPRPGTVLVLRSLPMWDEMIRNQGWLYKFKFYDINMDMVFLTSIATGDRVQVHPMTFDADFEEMANAHEGSQLQA